MPDCIHRALCPNECPCDYYEEDAEAEETEGKPCMRNLITEITDLIPEARSNSQYYTASVLKKAAEAIEKLSHFKKEGGETMDSKALKIVGDYIEEHLDKTDGITLFNMFIVWKAKVLQNQKWLISSTLPDGMYYEVTYNGDKEEFYLDAYKKFENRCIRTEG